MAEAIPKRSPRTHPGERTKIEVLNQSAKLFHGVPQEKAPTSYYTPELIQCTLPHSDPKARDWKRTNGNFTLIVSSGVDDKLEPYGVPYGAFPRLVLAYIITRVVQTGERRIELASHFGTFLKEIGYTGNLRGNTRASKAVHNQLLRLLRASITFDYREGDAQRGMLTVHDVKIAPKFALWWDYSRPDQGSLFETFIILSEDFHGSIMRAPVPLRTDILAALRKSPMALDVYMWVSYRLFTLNYAGQNQVTLSYGRLQEQFGTGISKVNYRSFRRDFKVALAKVAEFWHSPDGEKQLLNYELHEAGLTLFASPLLVPIPKRKIADKATTHEAAQILTNHKFDDLTIKQARQVAGSKWDVQWLEGQYFEWIEQEKIIPKNPRAHFLAFIKTHRVRNEK